MYYVKFDGERIGSSYLENGDPEIFSVSGSFTNVGGAEALAKWLKHLGGTEEEGTTHLVLNEKFSMETAEEENISYTEATLIAIPDSDEAYIDVTGVPEESYRAIFAKLVDAYENPKPELSLQDKIKALKNKNIV